MDVEVEGSKPLVIIWSTDAFRDECWLLIEAPRRLEPGLIVARPLPAKPVSANCWCYSTASPDPVHGEDCPDSVGRRAGGAASWRVLGIAMGEAVAGNGDLGWCGSEYWWESYTRMLGVEPVLPDDMVSPAGNDVGRGPPPTGS